MVQFFAFGLLRPLFTIPWFGFIVFASRALIGICKKKHLIADSKDKTCAKKIVSGSLQQDAIEDSMYYLQIPEACKTKCAFGILRKLNDFREIWQVCTHTHQSYIFRSLKLEFLQCSFMNVQLTYVMKELLWRNVHFTKIYLVIVPNDSSNNYPRRGFSKRNEINFFRSETLKRF